MKSSLRFAWLLLMTGCGSTVAGPVIDRQSDAPLDPAHASLLPAASAGVAYFALASLVSLPTDVTGSGCGSVATQGTTTTVTGMPCSGSGPIAGTLTLEGDASRDQTVTANQLVRQASTSCNGAAVLTTTTTRGTVRRTTQSDGSVQFHVDLAADAQEVAPATCQVTTTQYGLLYDGTFVPRAGSNPTDGVGTFNGTGRLSIAGWGQVHGQTTNEVIDGTCTSNLVGGVSSGTTTVTSGSHVAALTYGRHCAAGTSDVDWTLDGVAQGTPIPNVACTAQPWRARGPSGMALALGALATMTTVLRRGARRRAG